MRCSKIGGRYSEDYPGLRVTLRNELRAHDS
jgi:hypothetical protein